MIALFELANGLYGFGGLSLKCHSWQLGCFFLPIDYSYMPVAKLTHPSAKIPMHINLSAMLKTKWLLPMACTAVLFGCGGDDSWRNDDPINTPPDIEVPAPAPEEQNSPYIDAQKGDVLEVKIKELRPTQGAIGYDQIYYKLGRWQGDFARPTWLDQPENHFDYLNRTVGKKFSDYCEDMGAGTLDESSLDTVEKLQAARLTDASSFQCTEAPGTETENLKTVVIGPQGKLFLTDGHHSFSSLREIPDGGEDLSVWVKVDENFSALSSEQAFWEQMIAQRKTWLRNGQNQEITPAELPTRLGLQHDNEPGGIDNDPYRSLVYFTRGIGYNNGGLPEFAEFYWANWLREKVNLSDYKTIATLDNRDEVLAESTLTKELKKKSSDSTDSYAAAVRESSVLMAGLEDSDEIFSGITAGDLGRIDFSEVLNDKDALGDLRDELKDLPRNDVKKEGTPRGAGKIWFAVNYRVCGKPAENNACWGFTAPAAQ